MRTKTLARALGWLVVCLVLFAGARSSADTVFGFPEWATPSPDPNSYSPNLGVVSTAGDLNCDGYSDLALVRNGYSPGMSPINPEVRIYLGSALGLHLAPDVTITAGTATPDNDFSFGATLAAGDFNGDGCDDLLASSNGQAFVFLGRSNFTSLPPVTRNDADWKAADAPNGPWVVSAGDLDGDGRDEVVVGDAANSRVLVWRGSPTLGTDPDGSPATADWSATITGYPPYTYSAFGATVSANGDLNGDGLADILVGAPAFSSPLVSGAYHGAVVAYFGQVPLSAKPLGNISNPNGNIIGTVNNEQLGNFVAHVGDVNGDGYGDLAIGVAQDYVESLQAFWEVHGGSPGNFAPLYTMLHVDLPPGAPGDPPIPAPAGDVNGDGLADVVVRELTDSGPNKASVFLSVRGVGVSTSLEVPLYDPLAFPLPPLASSLFGATTAGDVNGDGFSDVALFEISGSGSTLRGLVYHGAGDTRADSSGFVGSPDNANLQDGSAFGVGMSAAGDLNGDGYSDFVVGQPLWDGPDVDEGHFVPVYGGSCGPSCGPGTPTTPGLWEGDQPGAELGWSVAGVGDLNADGYDDVVVGAPLWDRAAPAVGDAGRFQVYLGSAAGLAHTASVSVDGSDGAGAELGNTVSGAGDVNGDGRSDFLVSAPYANAGGFSQAGKVYLYLGAATPSGIAASPAWTGSGAGANQHFGFDLASAGDVNADGYSDVLITANQVGASSVCAAYLYLGGKNGLASTPAATILCAGPGDDYGISVSTGGDLNGDGFSDVAIGEPEWTGPLGANQGRVRVYHGSKAGLPASPATTLPGQVGGTRFGSGVGSGGDVDADGYGDLVVGEQYFSQTAFAEGRAHLYRGSPTGSFVEVRTLPGTPGVTSDYGRDVALNLDVNGDGFADVIVSAFGAVRGVPSAVPTGQVFGYFGSRVGPPRRVRALTVKDAPLPLLRTTDPDDDTRFLAASLLESASGREWMRAEVEVKPVGKVFDGTGLVRGPSFDLTALGGSPAEVTVHCAEVVGCHWRMRARSRNPYFPTTPWISPPGNTPGEADVKGFFDPDGDGVSVLADVCPNAYDPSQTNQDGDSFGDACDDCPVTVNEDQADGDADGVGDVCDSCIYVSNPRVDVSLLTAGPASNSNLVWATTTGGQRDDDHDGYGNKCDADFTPTGSNVGLSDTGQFNASFGKSRLLDTCGTGTLANKPCAIFDLDEGTAQNIGLGDRSRFNALFGLPAGAHAPAGSGKCAGCPLQCFAGSAGSCVP